MDYMSKTGLGAMAYMNMMGWWAMDLIGLRVMGKGQLVAAGTVVTLGISLSLAESHVSPSSDYENMCTVFVSVHQYVCHISVEKMSN